MTGTDKTNLFCFVLFLFLFLFSFIFILDLVFNFADKGTTKRPLRNTVLQLHVQKCMRVVFDLI